MWPLGPDTDHFANLDQDMVRQSPFPTRSSHLSGVLAFYQDSVARDFRKYNTSAVNYRSLYKYTSFIAVLFGTLAILMTIFQLFASYLDLRVPWIKDVEFFIIVLAFSAISVGLIGGIQRRWLLNRYKAQRCRLLKFGSMIDPQLWCESGIPWEDRFSSWKDSVERNLVKLGNLKDVHKAALRGGLDESNLQISQCAVNQDDLREIGLFYREFRTGVQLSYLSSRAETHLFVDRSTKLFTQLLFIVSVGAIIGRYLIEVLQDETLWLVSAVLLLIAVSIPVITLGVRTYRSTLEFGRSAMLFRSKLNALHHLDKHLEDVLKREPIDPKQLFPLLRDCEQFFDSENLEWVRIMLDAEWFV